MPIIDWLHYADHDLDPICRSSSGSYGPVTDTQRNVVEAVKTAKAVVINPIRLAIAIQYDPDISPLPTIVAKGEGAMAALIRETATEYGIPILQNIELARALHDKAELDEAIPEEFFEAIVEVLSWAGALK